MSDTHNTPVDWFFDYISPFAYLQWHRLRSEAPSLALRPVPVLFAGLLAHWDNKGPVEIPPKRGWTYAHCLWIARRHGITMRLPAGHPFNPLPLLRLSIALGNSPEVIDRLFAYVWRDGLPGAQGGGYRVQATEGGHIAFAPLDSIEEAILARLRQRKFQWN